MVPPRHLPVADVTGRPVITQMSHVYQQISTCSVLLEGDLSATPTMIKQVTANIILMSSHIDGAPVWRIVSRRGAGCCFIDSRNSNKMAAFYTVHTSSIRIFNCLYFF